MKLFSYTWVKYALLDQIQKELTLRKAQMMAAGRFIHEIAKGNLEAVYNHTDSHAAGNELSASLISMRDQMKKFSQEDKQRSWVTEGLAKFVDILRSKDNNNLVELSDSIISSLVKYLGANQGGLYLINDDNKKDEFIELVACYAYERKKHISQRIEIGQGLVGEAVFEKSTIFMTDIPADYIKITSGLGDALPRNLLIVPLKLDDKIFGIVEIASFDVIHPYQIQFVERLGESIASTISSVKTNQKTKGLLHETQVQAEQMRAQEEELRQNMEELTATQEEMQRILKEVQGQERYMNELIDSSSDSILVVDKAYKVVSANKTTLQSYASMGVQVTKGFNVFNLFNDADRPKYKAFYERALGGEAFHLTERYQSHGFDSYFLIQYTPIRNNDGEITVAAVFAKDITEMMKAQQHSETLANEAQQRNEELKAQEEELRQNMEELSATQDEMQRIILEVQNKEKYLNDIINISTDVIFTVDCEFKIISFNKAMSTGIAQMGINLEKGFCILDIFDDQTKLVQRAHYNRALKGESFQLTEHFNQHGFDVYSLINYAPVTNEKGEIFGVAVFSKDISEMQRMLNNLNAKERDLNELINASADSIWTIDRQYKLLTFNENFVKVFAARNVEVSKGIDMISVLKGDEQKIQIEIYARVFAGERFELNQTFSYAGADTHVILSYSPLVNDRQEVYGAAIYAKDVTSMINAQKRSEQLMRELQNQNLEGKQHEKIFGFAALLYEMDMTGVITDANDGLSVISGYSKEDLIGKPYNAIWHEDMPQELSRVVWTTIRQGDTFRFMLKNKGRNGKAFWTETTIVPIKNELKKIVGYNAMMYHFADEIIASIMLEKQMKKLDITPKSARLTKKIVRNGHESMKVA
jgi:PAS domain S-box-containing protein